MHQHIIIAALAILVTAAGCESSPTPQPHPGPLLTPAEQPKFASELERLVWLLGHPNFDKRIEAHNALLKMGKDILPDLEKAVANTRDEDHRRQVEILIAELSSPQKKDQKRDLLISLSVEKKSFEAKKPVQVTIEVKNAGDVPLDLTVPLLRTHSVAFRIDWTADMTFTSGGKPQEMVVSGKKRDPWSAGDSWSPSTLKVKPGDSIKETIDITGLCARPARYTAVATYRWKGVGDFTSNAVTFEVAKPPAPDKKDSQNK